MNRFQIYLNIIVRRYWSVGNEKIEDLIFFLDLDSAKNLGPHPNAECHKPSRFQSLWSAAIRLSIYLKLISACLENNMKKMYILKTFMVLACLTLTGAGMSVNAQDKSQGADSDSRKVQSQVASGQKMKVQGLILKRDNNTFILRDMTGSELTVNLAGTTKVEEKKGNPFRGAKKYSTDQVIRGLYVEVEGRGDASGALVAEKIKFSNDAQRVALSVNSQVVPVENRVGQAETRLSEAEQNAQRLSGQVEELTEVANLAKGGAAAAQQTAEVAVEGVNKTNERITSLDDYEEKNSATVNFKVGSAVLTPEGKAALDEIATRAKSEHGFVLEVRGFASSDGSESLNDRLSERRADAVVHYLAKQHEIPLRRIILPFGYGEALPVADNSTREGRKQNRRVEVKLMVNRGLTSPVNVNRPTSGDTH
jgi:outer membrane protein OmpA-like peptidoglycan-associated protein